MSNKFLCQGYKIFYIVIRATKGGLSLVSIKIVTDSTSYIPRELRSEHDISTVSLSVNFDSETYEEEQIDNSTFYEKMSKFQGLPTSSQPSPLKIYNIFEKLVSSGHSVVGIFISSDMSGTHSAALMAKTMIMDKYPDAIVEIIDSRSNCMEMGFQVLAAAKAAKEEMPIKEVMASAQKVINTSRFLFVPDTLEYLQKGGRIGGAAAFFGSILKIRPILTVIDGKTAVLGKVRTKTRAIQTMINTLLEDAKEKGLSEVVVHHINSKTEGEQIAKTIEEHLNISVPVYSIGPVIGLHVGPGTIGIAYYTKQ